MRTQAPWIRFAFLKVDSGWIWSPRPGKYSNTIWLPRKVTRSSLAGNGSFGQYCRLRATWRKAAGMREGISRPVSARLCTETYT